MSDGATILIIEDDPAIAEVLTFNLERDGHRVAVSSSGTAGLTDAQRLRPDLVILDLMLPGIDGLDICRELRGDRSTSELPILMLTARSSEEDEIAGLSVGADDYVTKPFSVQALLLRVRVLLQRKTTPPEPNELLRRHGVTIDQSAHQVFVGDAEVPVTPTEYRILETLMRRPGRAFSRTDLVQSAIGLETIVLDRTIDVHIRSLRRKLGTTGSAIETVRGVGYRFARD